MISLRDVVTGFGNRDPLAEVWRRNLRGGGGGAAEITGVPPLRYIGDGRPLTDYLLSGNTIQDGTPSPDAPVDAVGCGAWDETHQSYKIPLTVNGAEYPIYLGQVETTRRIKKLAFDGTEAWNINTSAAAPNNIVYLVLGNVLTGIAPFCTHYEGTDENVWGRIQVNNITESIVSGGVARCAINIGDATLTDFKSYLAAQYAAGTPVTVWYVLAEPETGIVNEPLMKIGGYTDTVSFAQAGVTIPTVSGENVLEVPTDVKPSEVTIKGGISSV